ncbi:hypothetical protein [Streptomyces sp. LARHCF252]
MRKNDVMPAEDPPLRVDLNSGTVRIRRTGHDGQEAASRENDRD